MMLDRRQTLAVCGAAIATVANFSSPVRAKPEITLSAAARRGRLTFGSAGGPELQADPAYRALFADQCGLLVPQNSMKFDALQPEQGKFNFAPADALVDGAREHGILARGTNLFWNDWLPPWLKALSRRGVEQVFEAYLDKVVPHFAGRLQSWDVVNEPFWLGSDKPGTYRPGVWYNSLGEDYIFRAFQRTAALDYHAKLVLNEAWTERVDPVGLAVRRSLLRLLDRMLEKGLKVDAIGLQGHLTPQYPYDDASFADFLHQIGERGVEIYITEFDIEDAAYTGDIAQRDAAVATRAKAFLDAVLAVPAVTMVITWGLSDRYSWWREPSVMTNYGLDQELRPLPFDDALGRKPMADAMASAFIERRSGVFREQYNP